jgi:hypothetical protein
VRTEESADSDPPSAFLEGVLDFLASLLEIAHALVALTFTFHLLVARCFAKVLLGSALDLVLSRVLSPPRVVAGWTYRASLPGDPRSVVLSSCRGARRRKSRG